MESNDPTIVLFIELFFKDNAFWVVPFILVVLQFMLKLFIAERTSGQLFWRNILQSPVDVGFLALSFTASLILAKISQIDALYGISLLYLVLLIVSTAIWKLSPTTIGRPHLYISASLLLINYFITVCMLVYSIDLLARIS